MFPNPADNWVQTNINNQNKAAQEKAAKDLEVYKTQLEEWKKNTIHAREIGSPIPAPPPLPKITVFSIGEGGGWIKSEEHVNAYAEPPSLPPMPTTKPGTVLGTGAAAFDDEMMRLLKAIAAKLGVS